MEELNNSLRQKKALENRTKRFAVAVFKLLDGIPASVSGKTIASQIGKSASSIGANYREANRAESRDDFLHKIGIALKECSETVYWLEVLSDLYGKNEVLEHLLEEAGEFLRIFQSAKRTLLNKQSNNSNIAILNRKSKIQPNNRQMPQCNLKS